MRHPNITGSILLLGVFLTAAARADITDFNEWTLVEDPAHPNLGSTVDSVSQVTLSALAGPVPSGTDIGYQSVNGSTAATAVSGWAFDPGSDFSIAVDFNLSFSLPVGGLGIGLGIGEDSGGMNSAGVGLFSVNGSTGFPAAFAGSARVNDVNQTPIPLAVPAQMSGRFLVFYSAAGGDVEIGVSTDGDNIAEGSGTFTGIQNSWNGDPLLVSFFLRSDNGGIFAPWTSGQADAVFTDFAVISGTPMAVPEPASMLLAALGAAALYGHRRRGLCSWRAGAASSIL